MNGGVCNLYELANWINGIAFRDIDFTPEGKPVIKIAEMKSGISENTGLTMNEFDEKYRVVSGDLLFSWSGSPKTSIFPLIWEGPAGWLNQHIFKVVPKEGISQDFLHLLLICLNRELIFLASNRMTTGLGHVTKSDLQRLRVNLPSKKERENIVRAAYPILSLESELKWTSDVNESIIQALFKSWFIDFDPVKANAEGKLPYGMDEENAALFPDSFEDSELGPIPTGWKWGQLRDCISVVGGGTPSTKNEEFWGGKYNWTSPKDLSNSNSIIMLDTERTITEEGLAKVSSGLLPKNTVLMSSRAPIGYLALAKIPVAINQGYIAIPPKNSMSPNFMLSWINYNMPLIEAYSSGSTFPEISKKEFRKLPILIPSVELIEKFNEETTRLYDSIETSLKQMNCLINTRDTLLPRLMSGQLKAPTEA